MTEERRGVGMVKSDVWWTIEGRVLEDEEEVYRWKDEFGWE